MFARKVELSGHDLVADFEAFLDEHRTEASERVAVVKHRLAELESESAALHSLLSKIEASTKA